MGFSTSAAFAILGICLIVCIDIISSSVFPEISDLNYTYRKLEERMVKRINTDIEITNVTNTSGLPYNLSIEIKNTGSTSLEISKFTVLINGRIVNFTSDKLFLYPEEIALINVTNLTDVGTNRVKVVSENGVSDYEVYNV